MSTLSASTRIADIHRRLTELSAKAASKQPWTDEDREFLATSLAQVTLLVQELLLESKKPMREMPVLPRRSY
jgi:hypothetical protein